MTKTPRSLPAIATALVLSVCGGYLFSLFHIPLPWMLGPLFFVGLAGINGIKVSDVRGGRQAGQLLVGCALGLYFTPEVSSQLLEYGGYIVLAAFLAIFIGGLGSLLLRRVSGIDAATAFFGSVPGGAAERAYRAGFESRKKRKPSSVARMPVFPAWVCEVEASAKIFTGVGASAEEASRAAQKNCSTHFQASSCQQTECSRSL